MALCIPTVLFMRTNSIFILQGGVQQNVVPNEMSLGMNKILAILVQLSSFDELPSIYNLPFDYM